jgi:3-mercaptopyruvate sulfurtransferase SseA
MMAPVRGARIVLADNLGPRANMTASWLAQMDWEVAVIDGGSQQDLTEQGPWQAPRPPLPAVKAISPAECDRDLANSPASLMVDFSTHAQYVRAHVPGACWVLRSQLDRAVSELSAARSVIVMAADDGIAAFCAQELQTLLPAKVELRVLQGGLAAWRAAGKPIEAGATRLLSPAIDRYRRPYEGTAVTPEAMQAYLDWEFGLVEQLRRDGSHHFRVI